MDATVHEADVIIYGTGFQASSVNSWYKNATGRSAQNWPFSLLDYWRRTRDVDVDEYEVP